MKTMIQTHRRKRNSLAAIIFLLSLVLNACSVEATPAPSKITGTPTQGGKMETTQSPSSATPESTSPSNQLTLWLPPEYDPNGKTASGELIKNQLEQFSAQYPEIQVNVRIKPFSGPGNMMQSLSATNAAATTALPDLVALDQVDFQSAAIKGFIYPVDGLATRMESTDWFPYARGLTSVEGTVFGIPFSGDVLVLASYKEKEPLSLKTWDDVLQQKKPLSFAAADPLASYTIANYLSAGGKLSQQDGKPYLDDEILKQVLSQYLSARLKNILEEENTSYTDATQVWAEMKKNEKGMGILWISIPIREKATGIEVAPLPMSGDQAVTLADGMVWAMANPDPSRQKNALLLLDMLSEPDFLSEWCQTAGCIPPRPSALAAYPDSEWKETLKVIENQAVAMPSSDLINSLGPSLRDAVLQVIRGQSTPEEAAQQAAGHFEKP